MARYQPKSAIRGVITGFNKYRQQNKAQKQRQHTINTAR